MKQLLVLIVVLAAACYVAACVYLYSRQRNFIYFPTAQSDTGDAQVLAVPSDGETLRILRIGANNEGALIYFGGNKEDVSQDIPRFLEAFPDRTVYLVNYRGYGGSTGTPTEAGLFKDALALFDLAQREHAHVSIMGRSLGSGVAVYVASKRKIEKLVLVTPYDSVENVARQQYPAFPIRWILVDKFASIRRAGEISEPTLILIAENDGVIPRSNSDALVRAFRPSIATAEVIAGAVHNTIGDSGHYWQRLRDFL